MSYMVSIVLDVILPIMIGSGILLQRKFNLDVKSFSKLILYYYIPALTFVKIYEAKISIVLLAHIVGFLLLQFLSLLTISSLISKWMRYPKGMSASFLNSTILANNANIGLPVNQLVFHQNAIAVATQIIVVIFELQTFTFGVINASAASAGLKQSIVQFLKMPVLAALILGFICNIFHVHLAVFIWQPLVNEDFYWIEDGTSS